LAEPDLSNPVVAVDVSSDGLVAAADSDGEVTVWDESIGDKGFVLPLAPRRAGVSDLVWSRDGSVLAIASWNGVTTLVDRMGEKVGSVRENKGYTVNSVALSPDGRLLATARELFERTDTATARVTLRDWRPGEAVLSTPALALSVDFDPAGERVAIASAFGPPQIWDLESGRMLELSGQTPRIQSIRFSPDGSDVAAAGADGTVLLWDAASGSQRLVLDGQGAVIYYVAFSPDGSKLVTGDGNGTVRIWALDLDDLIDIARSEVTRGFTEAECRQYLHQETCPHVSSKPS
jgi:WD40 repeat protein